MSDRAALFCLKEERKRLQRLKVDWGGGWTSAKLRRLRQQKQEEAKKKGTE